MDKLKKKELEAFCPAILEVAAEEAQR